MSNPIGTSFSTLEEDPMSTSDKDQVRDLPEKKIPSDKADQVKGGGVAKPGKPNKQ